MKKIGSQTRELLEESGMDLIYDEDEHTEKCGVILQDRGGGGFELWIKHDSYAGHVIEIDGVGYEFVREVPGVRGIDEMPDEPFIAKVDQDEGVFKALNIGDYRFENYELIDDLFVDNSGFGSSDEPALTAVQFLSKVKEGLGYAIIAEGQFQIYAGVCTPA